jgi:hypothetical protein
MAAERFGEYDEDSGAFVLNSPIAEFFAELTTGGVVACLAVFVFAVVKLVKYGAVGDYVLLVFGAVLSVVGLMGHMVISEPRGKQNRSFPRMFAALSGLFPYLFGSYLFFYRGLWRLTELLAEFSFETILKAFWFVVVGYAIVLAIYRLTEAGNAFRDGVIVMGPSE